jgi:hypothetical protein
MPQIYESAPLDTYAQLNTQRVVFGGGALTLPSLFLALSWPCALRRGLLRRDYIGDFSRDTVTVCLVDVGGQPTQLEVHADQLVIKRKWWRAIRVPFNQITAITRLPLTVEMRHVRLGHVCGSIWLPRGVY